MEISEPLPKVLPEGVQQGLLERFRGGGECFAFGVGWEGYIFGAEALELWVVVLEGVFPGPVLAVGTAALAAGGPLSFGSHLIEYKLLITCQR